jgi:hypothetical protein
MNREFGSAETIPHHEVLDMGASPQERLKPIARLALSIALRIIVISPPE